VRTRAGALLAVLVLLLTACGGGPAPRAWASDVCGAAGSLDAAMQRATDHLTPDRGDMAQTRTDFVLVLTTLEKQTLAFAHAVEKAGAPDVGGGERASTRLVRRLRQAHADFARERRQVAHLDTSDPGQMGRVFARVASSLKARGDGLADPLTAVSVPRLRAALRHDTTCARLRR